MDHLCNDSGKVLEVLKENTSDNPPRYVLSIRFFENRILELKEDNVHAIKCESPFDKSRVISFTCCQDVSIDIPIPVILFETEHGKYFEYHLIGFSLNSHKSFFLRKLQIKQKLTHIRIFDGPSILWNLKESLYMGIYSSETPGFLKECLLENDVIEANVLWSKYYTNNYLIFGKLKRKSGDKEVFLYICSDKPYKCDVSQILSPLYTNICCVEISEVKIIQDDDAFSIQSTVYAVTEDGCILRFFNGSIQFAFPADTNCDLNSEMVLLECVTLNKIYLSIFSDRKLMVFDVNDRKILNSWTYIKQVLCDDFVGNGSDQLLILSEEFTNKSGFILTDFDICYTDTISINSSIEEEKQNTSNREESKTNTDSAITALQSRFRNEKVSLNELQCDIDHRKQHIKELWRGSESLISDMSPVHTNNSLLIDLIGPEKSLFVENSPQDNACADIKVYDVWKRIIQDHLVVGVELKNISKRDYIEVHMTLVSPGTPDTPVLTLTSECCDLGKCINVQGTHNPSKKQRISPLSPSCLTDNGIVKLQSGQLMTTVCKTSVPCFSSSDHTKYELFMHWVDCKDDNIDKERKVIFVGEITLSSLDVLGDQYRIKVNGGDQHTIKTMTDLQRDVLTLNTVQLCTRLCVRSTRFPLCQLQSWLQRKAGLVCSSLYECLVFDKIQPLDGVRMYLNDSGDRKDQRLTVFTSCRNQLCLLLHHLYSVLPDDVIILPTNERQENISQLIDSLQEEIISAKSEIHQICEGRQSQDEIALANEFDEKGELIVENVRQNVLNRKLHVQNKAKLSVGGEDISAVSRKMDKMQLKSDIDLIKLACK